MILLPNVHGVKGCFTMKNQACSLINCQVMLSCNHDTKIKTTSNIILFNSKIPCVIKINRLFTKGASILRLATS